MSESAEQSTPAQFVSQPVTPDRASSDVRAMARGKAGLPTGFTWRGRPYAIRAVLAEWKASEAEDHAGGERYYAGTTGASCWTAASGPCSMPCDA